MDFPGLGGTQTIIKNPMRRDETQQRDFKGIRRNGSERFGSRSEWSLTRNQMMKPQTAMGVL
jgi:hypothetical protein